MCGAIGRDLRTTERHGGAVASTCPAAAGSRCLPDGSREICELDCFMAILQVKRRRLREINSLLKMMERQEKIGIYRQVLAVLDRKVRVSSSRASESSSLCPKGLSCTNYMAV